MNVYEKIAQNLYQHPDRPRSPKKSCPKCGSSFSTLARDKVPNYCSVCGTEIKTWYTDLYKKYKVTITENNNIVAEIDAQFKKDAIAYVSITGHPKAEDCYSLAWAYGHSSGLSSVLEHLEDFAELLK